MLPLTATAVRITLHVLAVSVWVGGQVTVLGLLPALRQAGRENARAVGRQFAKVAWAAFGLAVLTGVWNLFAVEVTGTTIEYQVTLLVKLALVAASGVGAFLHGRAGTAAGRGAWGGVGLLGGVAALFLGVLLRGG